MYFYISISDNENATATFSKILFTNSNNLDYDPYKEQTLTLNLGSLELETNQYLDKYNGQWAIMDQTGLVDYIDDGYSTLKNNLDKIQYLKSYNDQTNITSTFSSSNAQMILDSKAFIVLTNPENREVINNINSHLDNLLDRQVDELVEDISDEQD